MKCPVDGATLMMTERSGVEIDYCPQCRGVWLDRGELDKILARAQAPVTLEEPAAARPAAAPPPEPPPRDQGDGWRDAATAGGGREGRIPHGDDRRPYGDKLGEWRDRDEDAYRKKRRKGFLEDLFDF
jgi:hypothetical protein